MIELPYVFVQAMPYGVIIYAMIHFQWNAAKLFWFLLYMYFTGLYYTLFGMMALAVTPNQHIASIVTSATIALWNLFAGFSIPRTVSLSKPKTRYSIIINVHIVLNLLNINCSISW